MNNYIADEAKIIRYYHMVKMTRDGGDVTLEEAAREFTEKYAAKYEKLWHEGISQRDLRIGLFFPDEEGMR